jgi:ABC-type phosphate/phosphonate transport system substrate-binding protein
VCGILLVPLVALSAWLAHLYYTSGGQVDVVPSAGPEPLHAVVTDPLSDALAGAHAPDLTLRDYSPMAAYLEHKIGRPVQVHHARTLTDTGPLDPAKIDLVIGKTSVVQFEAARAGVAVHPIVRLTDEDGRTDLAGLFVVRKADAAKTVKDLADHRILFGSAGADEQHSAALALLAENGVTVVPPLQMAPNSTTAALAVIEGGADAAIIPAYAQPLLDGAGGIDKGALRVIGRTAPVPFITVFATAGVSSATERKLVDALLSARDDPQLLKALDSQAGFVELDAKPAACEVPPAPPMTPQWTDWRGPNRTGISPDVPARLPSQVKFLWRRGLTAGAVAGVAAASGHVIVADKNERGDQDIWRCLNADNGEEQWAIAYATPAKMEFTNAPRATPVIRDGLAYMLGAFGDLYCVDLCNSRILWRRNIIKDFDADLPKWGTCSTPLVVDDKLIVNPGAKDASLVALDLRSGEAVWKTSGEPAAYGSLIVGTFGGVRQIVGHDAASLGGWDPNSGRRLWTLLPAKKGDYNVPTPVNVDGRLLVSTENNGTRLYDFDAGGQIRPVPAATNPRLSPDSSTPVIVDGLVYGCCRKLVCLDLNNELKTLYIVEEDAAFNDYAALIAGNGHVLAISVRGELVLLKALRDSVTPVSRLRLFQDTEVWSHPALIANRLYIRGMKEICCILLDD